MHFDISGMGVVCSGIATEGWERTHFGGGSGKIVELELRIGEKATSWSIKRTCVVVDKRELCDGLQNLSRFRGREILGICVAKRFPG